jgi:hypothetical protein
MWQMDIFVCDRNRYSTRRTRNVTRQVLYPLSYDTTETWNPCVIKVILLACFTYIDIFNLLNLF